MKINPMPHKEGKKILCFFGFLGPIRWVWESDKFELGSFGSIGLRIGYCTWCQKKWITEIFNP